MPEKRQAELMKNCLKVEKRTDLIEAQMIIEREKLTPKTAIVIRIGCLEKILSQFLVICDHRIQDQFLPLYDHLCFDQIIRSLLHFKQFFIVFAVASLALGLISSYTSL